MLVVERKKKVNEKMVYFLLFSWPFSISMVRINERIDEEKSDCRFKWLCLNSGLIVYELYEPTTEKGKEEKKKR